MQKTTLLGDNDGVLADTEALFFQANRVEIPEFLGYLGST